MIKLINEALAQIAPVTGNCGFPGAPACAAGNTFTTVINFLDPYLDIILALVGLLFVIYIVYAGIKYINSVGSEESAAAAKRQIIYAIIGLIVAMSAWVILGSIIAPTTGATNIENIITPFIDMFLVLVSTVAVIYIIYAGYKYLTSQGNEEAAAQAKRQIVYAIIGIIVAIGAYIIRDAIVMPGVAPPPLGPPPLVGGLKGANAITTNLLDPFILMASILISTVAVIYLIYAGYKYLTSQGNEESAAQAKRQIAFAVVGIIIAIGAFSIRDAILAGATGGLAGGAAGGGIIITLLNPFIIMAQWLIAIFATIYFLYAGYRYITSAGDEQTAAQAKNQMIYGVIGIIIAAGASIITQAFVTGGGILGGILIRDLLLPFIAMAQWLIGTFSTIFFIYAGYRYITSAGDEQVASQAKSQMIYAVIGIIIAAGAFIITDAFILSGPLGGLEIALLIIPAINALLVIAGVAAVAYTILSGIMYFSASGQEDQISAAKRQLIYAIVGIIVIILSATIVNFIRQAIT